MFRRETTQYVRCACTRRYEVTPVSGQAGPRGRAVQAAQATRQRATPRRRETAWACSARHACETRSIDTIRFHPGTREHRRDERCRIEADRLRTPKPRDSTLARAPIFAYQI